MFKFLKRIKNLRNDNFDDDLQRKVVLMPMKWDISTTLETEELILYTFEQGKVKVSMLIIPMPFGEPFCRGTIIYKEVCSRFRNKCSYHHPVFVHFVKMIEQDIKEREEEDIRLVNEAAKSL